MTPSGILGRADRIGSLASGRVSWDIPWPRVHEFLEIVSHPRIYDPPSNIGDAADQVDAWLASPVAAVLGETDSHWNVLKDVLLAGRVRGLVVHDARVAAICMVNGVTAVWTADRDFRRSRSSRFGIRCRTESLGKATRRAFARPRPDVYIAHL